ncbi:hypothetical protein [Salmonella enterica]|uniref:Ead/Ea22-like family protein n=2 Tax=Salmonella enterica TaxID=28901 RepID=A0A379QMB1_SALER|nr:hypothetical protein [Salmonella enterica]ASG87582.1 hypothetical protein LFZ47_08285 [Salmonella enterica subsp. salamae serovar 55:k:z39 str. 1315K]ECF5933288.1 hypothetical protein [Salmonella enterica subsp. salamae]ECG1252003.1 hypothetical protein [Salmonella enterica subsp. salamae]SUF56666.1 Uncharacterised protein [Salmonella enterica]
MNIDKQALLGPDKHANQHRLSRLIAEANSAEIRDIAESVEQYTDQLIAALANSKKRIAELEAKLANPVLLPKTNGYWNEQEKAYEEAITLAKQRIRMAGFRCEGDE